MDQPDYLRSASGTGILDFCFSSGTEQVMDYCFDPGLGVSVVGYPDKNLGLTGWSVDRGRHAADSEGSSLLCGSCRCLG